MVPHSDVSATLGIYALILSSRRRQAAEKVAGVLRRDEAKTKMQLEWKQ